MFSKILIANRGEIACRIARTARALGVRTVAVYSEADREALHVAVADEAFAIGGAPPCESYLNVGRIVEAALRSGAEAVHPGYGFLSESPELARACGEAGLCFVGPPVTAIEAMAHKDAAKRTMQQAGVPVLAGVSLDGLPASDWSSAAESLGYPVLIKAVAGGGGKGMRRVDDPAALHEAIEAARREASAAFGDGRVLLEKWLERPRHVEVQVFADRHGQAVHLFERDCSMQRRHQKVVEEAPAPGLDASQRAALGEAAVAAARAIGYEGAGTCEFLLDAAQGAEQAPFYFMEMNTRLQVEHPVTEAICGVDLVEWQLRVAAGEPLPRAQHELSPRGHAVEVRVYAEDPFRDYLPQTGRLDHVHWPQGEGIRVDAGVMSGDEVSMHYDPLLAKIIAHGDTRAQALGRLRAALENTDLAGVRTNLAQLAAILAHPDFAAGRVDTGLLARERDVLLADDLDAARLARVLGCVAQLEVRQRESARQAARHSPWATTDAYRVNLPRRDRLHVQSAGDTREVVVELHDHGLRLHCDGVAFDVSGARLDGHRLQACVDGRWLRAGATPRADGVEVRLSGRLYRLIFQEQRDATASTAPGGSAVLAPMPGQVQEVRVEPGQRVARGEPLVRLTAMKMEHTLLAEAAGLVARVHVGAGAQVSEGDVLVELRPPDAEEEGDAG